MDTPQVTPGLLESAPRYLADGTVDAVFGPAADGGFWRSIQLRAGHGHPSGSQLARSVP
jgi:glycosyltransferase A (GT-A) superfamily protein (DUF2064 family)